MSSANQPPDETTVGQDAPMSPHDEERLGLWERPHRIYLGIAFGISWMFWIGSWVISRTTEAGDQLINADLVWGLVFGGTATRSVVWLSLLSLLGVYGPMVAGVVASRLDPAIPRGDLAKRIGRFGVGWRTYGLVVGILLMVVGPTILAVALTTDLVPDVPPATTILGFLGVFFVFQLLTSGTEEIGWRGYLDERLRHGRSFWETGWAVGLPWAVWHYPIVVIIFGQQGMAPAAIVGSLAGFTMGIIAASILHSWFYDRHRSVFLNIFIHALFNTVPLATTLLYRESPAAVIANLLLWVVVFGLKRRFDGESERPGEPAPS
jgi:membrane protease YdiL (CAAX protease family)